MCEIYSDTWGQRTTGVGAVGGTYTDEEKNFYWNFLKTYYLLYRQGKLFLV